jgi:hypothetical protein
MKNYESNEFRMSYSQVNECLCMRGGHVAEHQSRFGAYDTSLYDVRFEREAWIAQVLVPSA